MTLSLQERAHVTMVPLIHVGKLRQSRQSQAQLKSPKGREAMPPSIKSQRKTLRHPGSLWRWGVGGWQPAGTRQRGQHISLHLEVETFLHVQAQVGLEHLQKMGKHAFSLADYFWQSARQSMPT